jgi:hypothetical protein
MPHNLQPFKPITYNLSSGKPLSNFAFQMQTCSATPQAYSTGGVKGAFFTAGVCYGMTTFYTAFLVYAAGLDELNAVDP